MPDIASYIDHTLLKTTGTKQDILTLCHEALEYGFAAVCVPPFYVKAAKEVLAGTNIKIATVIGFPLGYNTVGTKLTEVINATDDGAQELDIVHTITAVKNQEWDYLQKEIGTYKQLCHTNGCSLKIILETGVLTDEEIAICCEIYGLLGVDFLKTSTGFAETGATVHVVNLMRKHLPARIGIKASGGIRNLAFARELIEAGATRIGTSAGVAIVKQSKEA